jgi:hypothetical protein
LDPFSPFELFSKDIRYKAHLFCLSSQETNESDLPNIFTIGSISAEFGEAGHCDNSTSKSGLTHRLVKSVKNEIVKIHPNGRINSVYPG